MSRVIGFLMVVLAATSCSVLQPIEISESAPVDITYTVYGTAPSSSISFNNESDGVTNVGSKRDLNGNMRWERTVFLKPGKFAYAAAQNNGENGSVIVEISSQGRTIKHSESSGAYCISTTSSVVR
jgi:hypothetical protein